ncbi:MAG: ribosome small subunit-dependent GTPase A [Gemmatimonadota bacterium]|nr:MAG: ribosome small subunit-dependent GTPase A [Gemmatimonadota bacterium]
MYRIRSDGEIVETTLRGRFKQGHAGRVLVGDRVVVQVHDDGGATIEELLPRRSVLQRRTPGRSRGVRNVAANVDQIVVVGAAKDPPWDEHLIDRFVVVAEVNGLAVTVVVNKCDLVNEPERLADPYARAGYEVVLTSVPESRNLETLRALLEGQVSLFAGPTGVGKSSLLNALQPGLELRTGSVSAKSRGGRHTTVAAEMHAIGKRGYVVDTPGLRDVGLWGVEPLEVALAFPEFADYAQCCRFDNCRHIEEPDCAVVKAVTDGEVASSRLASYRRLLDEAVQAARQWS